MLAQTEIIKILNSAGFPLKKITANNSKLLTHIEKEDLYDAEFLRFHDTSSTKTLGIKWNALTDAFTYAFSPITHVENITKRQILSSVAKHFDPAGWLAPVIIRAKILMQQLWLEGIDWDDDVSSETIEKWNSLTMDLSDIEKISIPRWIKYNPNRDFGIHGFSDASKSAYCATVYIRCPDDIGNTFSKLLVAKTKVVVVSSLKLTPNQVYLWTDSTITLSWLSKPPSSWETYIANRTSRLHSLVPGASWRHVPTLENPADIGTRGSTPAELADNQLWWHGPSWLTNPSTEWPKTDPRIYMSRCKEQVSLHTQIEADDILDQFSSYYRALRVIGYIFRFYYRCTRNASPNTDFNTQKNLTQEEIRFVKNRLITLAQKSFYSEEYETLSRSKPLSNKSPLKNLNPFIDKNLVLRVNGRLAQSHLAYNERYPVIMPGNSRLCHLYLNNLHNFLLHADCSLMCRMSQQEFYISKLKIRVKKIIRCCKTCVLYKQNSGNQIMAPLPPERCDLRPPFHITGIDFAGPFEIKSSSLRRSPYTKGYVSVFVCFGTKAIHLEACSELSSAAFQATFSRFVGRRGLPRRVVTDNGRNFLGASRLLEEEFSDFVKKSANDIAAKYIAHGFEWQFIPPHAPHMGGLWEAAVKSFKYHFRRIAGAQKFTFEEFSTLLARIEGVLNSRPLSAVSEDPEDLTALTPGHFLRGAPLLAFPELCSENLSVINRWEKLRAMHHQFSLRWKNDYLKSLHKRYKWKESVPNLNPGELVVVMDDLSPPHEWRLGRIEKTHSGADGNVRTADVRISTGVITRPIVKLVQLPLQKT